MKVKIGKLVSDINYNHYSVEIEYDASYPLGSQEFEREFHKVLSIIEDRLREMQLYQSLLNREDSIKIYLNWLEKIETKIKGLLAKSHRKEYVEDLGKVEEYKRILNFALMMIEKRVVDETVLKVAEEMGGMFKEIMKLQEKYLGGD